MESTPRASTWAQRPRPTVLGVRTCTQCPTLHPTLRGLGLPVLTAHVVNDDSASMTGTCPPLLDQLRDSGAGCGAGGRGSWAGAADGAQVAAAVAEEGLSAGPIIPSGPSGG